MAYTTNTKMAKSKKTKNPLDQIEEQAIAETKPNGKDMQLVYEAEKPLPIKILESIKEFGYKFRFNEVRQVFEYALQDGNEWKDLEERQYKNIWLNFQMTNKLTGKERPSVKKLYDLVDTDIYSQRYHPIEEYYKSLKWDGADHITKLAQTITCEDLDLKQNGGTMQEAFIVLFRRWLIASVVCNLGINPNHVMLLLIGGQGLFKTTWLNRLCPKDLSNYQFCGHINPNLVDNNTCDLLAEKAFVNIDDQLETVFGKDFNSIKSVITTSFVSNRKAYRRDTKKRPRIANFVGSVNSEEIFHDVQNRRYLTFKIAAIDIKAKVDINQVWAQAYHLFTKGERYYFDKSDEAIINEINSKFSVISNEQEWFMRCYEVVDESHTESKCLMPSEILSILQRASGLKLFQFKLTNAFTKLNLKKISKRVNNNPRYVYVLREKFEQKGGIIKLKPEHELQTSGWVPVAEQP